MLAYVHSNCLQSHCHFTKEVISKVSLSTKDIDMKFDTRNTQKFILPLNIRRLSSDILPIARYRLY